MPDEDFQKLYYISLLENVNSKEITEHERTRIFDLYIHSTRQEDPIETSKRKKDIRLKSSPISSLDIYD